MVYLVNLDQKNLLKTKGMSYCEATQGWCIEDAREATHVILMSLEE